MEYNIGEKINVLRKANGFSIVQVADFLNVTTKDMLMWENDFLLPKEEILEKMADLFNCKIEFFIRGKKNDIKYKQKINFEDIFVADKHASDLYFKAFETLVDLGAISSISRFMKFYRPYKIYKNTLYIIDNSCIKEYKDIDSSIFSKLEVAVHSINKDVTRVKPISEKVFYDHYFNLIIKTLIKENKINVNLLKELFLGNCSDELFYNYLEILELLEFIIIDENTKMITSNISREKYCKIYGKLLD